MLVFGNSYHRVSKSRIRHRPPSWPSRFNCWPSVVPNLGTDPEVTTEHRAIQDILIIIVDPQETTSARAGDDSPYPLVS